MGPRGAYFPQPPVRCSHGVMHEPSEALVSLRKYRVSLRAPCGPLHAAAGRVSDRQQFHPEPPGRHGHHAYPGGQALRGAAQLPGRSLPTACCAPRSATPSSSPSAASYSSSASASLWRSSSTASSGWRSRPRPSHDPLDDPDDRHRPDVQVHVQLERRHRQPGAPGRAASSTSPSSGCCSPARRCSP